MAVTSTSNELSNEQFLEYLKTVRDNLGRFEDLTLRLILQGIPVIIGLITATSFLVRFSIPASLVTIVGVICFTLLLFRLGKLYVDLMWVCSSIASEIEEKLFKGKDDLKLTNKIAEKISSSDVKGTGGFRKHKWETVLFLTYFVLLAIESVLLVIYLSAILAGLSKLG